MASLPKISAAHPTDGSELDSAPGVIIAAPVGGPRKPGGINTDLSLPRQVISLAIWPLIELSLGSLVGFVDMALAGHLGDESKFASSAVGAAAFVVWLMAMMQASLGVGATAVIARAVGGRHRREANAAVGQAITLAGIFGVAVAVGSYFAAPSLAQFSGLTGRPYELCIGYLRIMTFAVPFMTVLYVAGACLRGAGDVRSASLVMLMVNAVNICATVLLVAGPEPLGGRGVPGIATGTVIAWIVGSMLMIGRLVRGRGGVQLHLHRLGWHTEMMRRIVRIGAPSLLENLLVWGANYDVLRIVGKLNNTLVGVHTITIRLEAFSFQPGSAFGIAAATMVGQYLGARDPAMARKAAWTCWLYGAAFMSFWGLLFIAFPWPMARMMTSDPELIAAAIPTLRIAGVMQLGFSMSLIISGALRGAGDTRTTMLVMLFTSYLVRLPLAWMLANYFGLGLIGVWIALTSEQYLRGAIFMARFLHGGWMKIKV